MDIKDKIIQEICPVFMVPRYSELPTIESGYRYLMAADGLWIETRVSWGHFRMALWKSPRVLPYGEVSEVYRLESGPIPMDLLTESIAAAKSKAEKNLEWAGWIVWDADDGYRLIEPEVIKESFTSVLYRYPKLNSAHLVIDLHSHPFDMPSFSGVDDHDDMGGVRFSGIISFGENMAPALKLRLCIEGHFFLLGGMNETLHT